MHIHCWPFKWYALYFLFSANQPYLKRSKRSMPSLAIFFLHHGHSAPKRHGGHIGVPKQWIGGYVGVPNKSSFLMQTPSFVPINLHRYWPREWKHSILYTLNMTLNRWTVVTLNSQAWLSFFTSKYVHIRDFKHASRAVFACCERDHL